MSSVLFCGFLSFPSLVSLELLEATLFFLSPVPLELLEAKFISLSTKFFVDITKFFVHNPIVTYTH